jgi:hypothetical protein
MPAFAVGRVVRSPLGRSDVEGGERIDVAGATAGGRGASRVGQRPSEDTKRSEVPQRPLTYRKYTDKT